MTRALIPTVIFLALVASAFAQVQPALTMSFDKDFNGVGPRGAVAGTPVGTPVLVPGRSGPALKAGPTGRNVDFPTEGVLNRLGGTVEMWVCPVDWASDDGKFHVFFQTAGRGALYLYKYWTTTGLLMLTSPELAGPYASSQQPTHWKPGEWHHVAGTWSPQGVMSYVDGQPSGKMPVVGGLPTALARTFSIGDDQWQFPRTTSSLIDEVRVYDRPLTPAHIAAHAAGNYAFSVPLSAKSTQLGYTIDTTAKTLNATLDIQGADVDDARVTVAFAVDAEGMLLPTRATRVGLSAGQVARTMPLPSTKPGAYDIVASVFLDGQPAFELRRSLVVPDTSWLGSKLALEDKVLPPWTPLRTEGTTVSCWGRQYRFDGAVLPTQITSAGAELLSRPVSLRLVSGGKPVAIERQAIRAQSVSPTRAELLGVATTRLGGTECRFTSRVSAEYDGLAMVELSCAAADKLPLDGLSVDIPVKAERAIYRNRSGPGWGPTAGAVPAGEGVVDKSAFIPFAWLGDNDRGLFWCCESDEMWPNRAGNAIEIVRSGQEIVLRLNVLAAGQKLPPNWKLTFGLLATPVKPIPHDWRKWRLTGASAPNGRALGNVEIVWPFAGKQDSLSAFGYPEARNPKLFAQYIKGLHDQGLQAVPYLCLTWITDGIPEWRWFREAWDMGAVDLSIPDAGWDHAWDLVSPVAKGYSDFIITRTKQFMDRYGIDGVYHDQTSPYASANLSSGCGYTRDGQVFPTYPILGYRALYRRDYAMVKALPRETFTMAHMSGKMLMPVLAYDDSYLDGENYRDVVKDSYMDVMTLETFRAEYMGRQWGLMPYFIPELDTAHQAQIEPTRGMMALLMLHDVSPWPVWCNRAVVGEAFAALDAFGYVDAEFIPYFDPKPPATTDMADVYVSAYRRSDGRVLLIVSNLSKQDRTGTVTVNATRLGTGLGKVLHWPGKQPLAVTKGRLPLDVPRLGYRMVVIENP